MCCLNVLYMLRGECYDIVVLAFFYNKSNHIVIFTCERSEVNDRILSRYLHLVNFETFNIISTNCIVEERYPYIAGMCRVIRHAPNLWTTHFFYNTFLLKLPYRSNSTIPLRTSATHKVLTGLIIILVT